MQRKPLRATLTLLTVAALAGVASAPRPAHAGTAVVGQIVFNGTPSSSAVRGSGKVASVERRLVPFEQVVITLAATVHMAPDTVPSARIQAEDNLLAFIETRVERGVLYVAATRSIEAHHAIEVKLSTPRLTRLEQRASGDVDLTDVQGERLALSLIGTGHLRGSGQVATLHVELLGSGEIDTWRLRSEQAAVEIRGAGNVKVHAVRSLSATISGVGNVIYQGSPAVRQRIIGVGQVFAAAP